MTTEEIRASGLLELYVLGQLSAEEERTVRGYLEAHPELKQDLFTIGRALEGYAHVSAVKPSPEVRQRILDEIGGQSGGARGSTRSGPSRWWPFLAVISVLAVLGLLYLLSEKNTALQEAEIQMQAVIDSCSRESQQYVAQLELYQHLTDEGTEIVHMGGTEKYPQTDLYLYHNTQTQRNIIQVKELPALAQDQSFQLWSLKPNTDPIPLDVFQGVDTLLEVRYEDASQSYAITIEPLGGRQSPTLENLIGIVNVGG